MEVFRTKNFYIFIKGQQSLWCDRETGVFIPKADCSLREAIDPVCLGLSDGLIGKVEHPSVFATRLLLIKEGSLVGRLHGQNVYKINSIAFLSLQETPSEHTPPPADENVLKPCPKHKSHHKLLTSLSNHKTSSAVNVVFDNAWGTLKNAGNTIKSTTQHAIQTNPNRKERFERQIIEEFHKIFNYTDSFYYSFGTDLTNSLQRLCTLQAAHNTRSPHSIWRTVDDRFFWNKYMLKDLLILAQNETGNLCDPWVLPIIQGYIQIEDCKVYLNHQYQDSNEPEVFTLCILSRRSRFRAGTRYKRRGVDENGQCANYVETEQLISYQTHEVSFVQVRGSVPIYWSQPGYKYRPPPRIDKGERETTEAFQCHFAQEVELYGPVCAINLIDQSGKERIIFDAYSNYMLTYNSPFLTYVTFDFHEYCRGMHFENVSILINALSDLIKDMNFCWRDKEGNICMQTGVFRVNCIDCLDRTNVVQTAIGKAVMELQFCKLGLISPEGVMPSCIKTTFQLLWANNGDIISKQYAGTNALKGDYTRTGERKISGIMRDGMNSANRYYLSRFKDSTRQGTIDLMLGEFVSEEVFNESKVAQHQHDDDILSSAEHVKLLLEDSKKMLIHEAESVLGCWALINADPVLGDPNETEMDTILILTKDAYYVADYDEHVDKMTKYFAVQLRDITFIECGLASDSTASLLFKSGNRYRKLCLRINYTVNGSPGYYHMFRCTSLRFFNNVAVLIKNEDEEMECLKAIGEAILIALDLMGLPLVALIVGKPLERRKSKVLSDDGGWGGGRSGLGTNIYLDFPQMTRNVSESHLLSLKNVGSKALSNMTQQFSKLGHSLKGDTTGSKRSRNAIAHSDKDNVDDSTAPAVSQPYSDDEVDSNLDSDEDFHHPTQLHASNSALGGLSMKSDEFVLPSVGIVMGSTNTAASSSDEDEDDGAVDEEGYADVDQGRRRSSDHSERGGGGGYRRRKDGGIDGPLNLHLEEKPSRRRHDGSQMDNVQLTSIMQTPEIQVDEPGTLAETTNVPCSTKRSTSDYDVLSTTSSSSSISQSHSESALKSKTVSGDGGGCGSGGGGGSGITDTGVVTMTKDFVIAPISRIARGVQHLGSNFDPRRLTQAGHRAGGVSSEAGILDHAKWQQSKTRLIAL